MMLNMREFATFLIVDNVIALAIFTAAPPTYPPDGGGSQSDCYDLLRPLSLSRSSLS
jgi:hypothetical protein